MVRRKRSLSSWSIPRQCAGGCQLVDGHGGFIGDDGGNTFPIRAIRFSNKFQLLTRVRNFHHNMEVYGLASPRRVRVLPICVVWCFTMMRNLAVRFSLFGRQIVWLTMRMTNWVAEERCSAANDIIIYVQLWVKLCEKCELKITSFVSLCVVCGVDCARNQR